MYIIKNDRAMHNYVLRGRFEFIFLYPAKTV